MSGIKPHRRKGLRIFLLIAGILALCIAGLQFWFVNNAEDILKQYIYNKSKGEFRIELAKIKYRFFSSGIEIYDADLVSTDTLSPPITYHVQFQKLSLKLTSVWPLLLEKKLVVDSIKLDDPIIEVLQWRKDTSQVIFNNELSIPQEMGKLYNSMVDALDAFDIRRIVIDNAEIRLINKINPEAETVAISNIYFDMDRLGKNKNKDDLPDEKTLTLRSNDQYIILPGGRHHLSFKNFNLQLFRQRIELDSCIITAIGTDSVKSNYQIFFKKLMLVGVDFNAMYTQNKIKADTVFCESPFLDLNLYRQDTTFASKTDKQDPEKIMRDLSGNLDLAYVGVKNIGINIDINGVQSHSFNNSYEDNFEIRGLRINPDSQDPVAIDRFDLTLKTYQINNQDSSLAYTFDSLKFLNRKIVLHEFSVVTKSTKNQKRDESELRIPYFELTQLDWAQLIFDQNLEAREALLINPVINYTKNRSVNTRKKVNLYESLKSLDSLIALENLHIVNGQVNMNLGPSTFLNLQDLNINLHSNQLLSSTDKEGMQDAVQHLSFSNGRLQLRDILLQLHNAKYTGDKFIYADKVSVVENRNKISAAINNAYLDNLQVDDEGEMIELDGLKWESASVVLQSLPASQNGNSSNILDIKNISGKNTQIDLSTGNLTISTFVDKMEASLLYKKSQDPLYMEGFVVDGKKLNIKSGTMNIDGAAYHLQSNAPSFVSNVQMEQIQGQDSFYIQSSHFKFITDLNGILAEDLHFKSVDAKAPVIKISRWKARETDAPETELLIPTIKIDEFIAHEPTVHILTLHKDSLITIDMPWNEKSMVKATGFKLSKEGLELENLVVNTANVNFIAATGENFNVEKGKVDLEFSDINLASNEGILSWNGLVHHISLENASGLNIGKTKKDLHFQEASMGNLNVSSENIINFNELLKANVSAWLRIPTGQFSDSVTTLKWYNAEYNNSNKTLNLDSIVYQPTRSKDSLLAIANHEFDYIVVNTGAVEITDLDIEKFKNDSSFFATAMTFNNPQISIFRDKKPPKLTGVKKSLPVDMIKAIALPVDVKSILVKDGTISYTEKNERSRKEGTVTLTRLNGKIENIRNCGLSEGDSLTFKGTAYLMDSALFEFQAKQSFMDSLSSFLLTMRMEPTSLAIFNPMAIPIANVQITSGTLDSLSLRAIGREDISLGAMNMHYHDLRVKLVKDGDLEKTTLLRILGTFLANTFMVNKSNNTDTGLIYFKREERPFFNYVVKMALSGIATSVGIKNNKKYVKEYEREIEKNNAPPIIL
ncbi:hypothetical protein BH23BAC1_BH23BAC1_24750 [soil metagenome]